MALNPQDIALGIGLNVAQEGSNLIFGQMRQKQQLRGQKKALEQQNAAAYDLWQKTNYPAQMEQLRKAGLNPGLLYGMGGPGGTLGSSSSMPDVGNMGGMGLLQGSMLAAQIANINADTKLKETQANKTGGVDTAVGWATFDNLVQNTANQKAQEVLTKAKTTTENITQMYLGESLDDRLSNLRLMNDKLANEIRIVDNNADISDATKQTAIDQIRQNYFLSILQAEAVKQGISESKTRQWVADAEVTKMFRSLDQEAQKIEILGKNANTQEFDARTKFWAEQFSQTTGLGVDIITKLLQATIFGGMLKGSRTVVQGFGR